MESNSTTSHENPAIERCMNAWNRVYRKHTETQKFDSVAMMQAAKAYRGALPALDSQQNIRDFVACVAHGMLFGTIQEESASKLLYAAQVAVAALKCKPSAPKSAAA